MHLLPAKKKQRIENKYTTKAMVAQHRLRSNLLSSEDWMFDIVQLLTQLLDSIDQLLNAQKGVRLNPYTLFRFWKKKIQDALNLFLPKSAEDSKQKIFFLVLISSISGYLNTLSIC